MLYMRLLQSPLASSVWFQLYTFSSALWDLHYSLLLSTPGTGTIGFVQSAIVWACMSYTHAFSPELGGFLYMHYRVSGTLRDFKCALFGVENCVVTGLYTVCF